MTEVGRPIDADPVRNAPALPLEAKLRFLGSTAAYPGLEHAPECIETHMSWVFLAGTQVLKLKKPVRFPFLDFSTLEAREFYCREELRLNARLAPGVYLGLLALQMSDDGFALVPAERLPAAGQTVDWLVRMRRLPRERMLDTLIAAAAVRPGDIDALLAVLAAFYRRATRIELGAPRAEPVPGLPPVGVEELGSGPSFLESGHEYVARFEREQAANREVLLRPQFQVRDAAPALARCDAALARHAALLRGRAIGGCIVDGHGDLRPEHVCLLQPPVVIDCLEFNARLRQVDPCDEIAYLALECEMAGAAWIGPQLVRGAAAAFGQTPPALIPLYTAYRALLRARLALAHLLDPQPRTPQKWPPLAQRYVERALTALDRLDAIDSAAPAFTT